MQLVRAVAQGARSAGVRQEIGEHLIAPAGPVVEGSIWISRLYVGPRTGNNIGISDEHQPVRSGRLARHWLSPDAYVGHSNAVQSPTGHRDGARNASGIVRRSIEAAKWQRRGD